MQTELVYGRPCSLPGCPRELKCGSLCGPHYGQVARTSLTPAEFIARFAAQQGACPYCLERIGAKFDVDHFHGACERAHLPGKTMCRECIRGMIHRKCNWELIWLDRAIAAGRGGVLAPHVEAYVTGRPFLLAAAA